MPGIVLCFLRTHAARYAAGKLREGCLFVGLPNGIRCIPFFAPSWMTYAVLCCAPFSNVQKVRFGLVATASVFSLATSVAATGFSIVACFS